MEGREVGDKVGEDGWDPGDEFRVDEADSTNPYNAQARTQAEEPVDGDLVLNVEFVLLRCSVVPHTHYHHKYQ